MTVVQLVDCQAVELAMNKEAVATPVFFQQMDLKGQAALKNLSLYIAHGTHSLPTKHCWFIHTVKRLPLIDGQFAPSSFLEPLH